MEKHDRQSNWVPLPMWRLLYRLIQGMATLDRYVACGGRASEITIQRHSAAPAPLDQCEIDHAPLDLTVIDDEAGPPLGRSILTVCVDGYTRCVIATALGRSHGRT